MRTGAEHCGTRVCLVGQCIRGRNGQIRHAAEQVGYSSAGNTRGLIEAGSCTSRRPSEVARLPRGIPAASLKRAHGPQRVVRGERLPRGIPAASLKPHVVHSSSYWIICLPRGIPAASLKPDALANRGRLERRLPRGIPAASLKHRASQEESHAGHDSSSAGNTRGLIEAPRRWCPGCRSGRLPRGIPAASLKQPAAAPAALAAAPGLPRGIPAASLKPWRLPGGCRSVAQPASSAGNTRGLIEAFASRRRRRALPASSAGNTRGLIEARSTRWCRTSGRGVFRGEYPRPH